MAEKLKPSVCHKCGVPRVDNPHPDAGKPDRMLEVGCPQECLPCTVLSRHQWAQRAYAAEKRIRELESALESRASNAGGAVAWSVTNDGGRSISSVLFADYYDAADHARRCGGTTKPIRVYTHPAPASKEPVVDERAAFESAYVEHRNTQEIHSYIGARDYTGEEIASLREGQNYGFDRSYLNGCWAGWKMARAALATAQTWIPVSERLPECKHECTTSGHDVSTTVLMHGTCIARFPGWAFGHLQSDGKWICYDSEHDFMDLTEVTHWMPLPAAPAKPEGV